jgi:CheY-like chemotaxis protein
MKLHNPPSQSGSTRRFMAQRVFIKVVGFTDEERHALNTVFRLSEQCRTMYQLWTPDAPEAAGLALLDGLSYEAPVEAEIALNADLKMLWVGPDAPAQIWRSFDRPIAWPDIIEAMDAVFVGEALDFDVQVGEPTTGMSLKQALIVCADRDDRLYLRARLALAHLTLADEAESGSQAVELARDKQYDIALVGFGLPDMDGWAVLRELRDGKRPIPHLAVTKARRSLPEHLRAWLGGTALLDAPPHPAHLNAWLKSI